MLSRAFLVIFIYNKEKVYIELVSIKWYLGA